MARGNKMEGVLYKWTNYYSGWQQRWFILDNGILTYYKSQDDVDQGCKGSLKMAVCEIHVHPTDMTRLELTIPGEQYFYLKAPTFQERQQWLVALGSSKACITNINPPASAADVPIVKSKKSELRLFCDLLIQQVHAVKHAVNSDPVDTELLDDSTVLLTETCDTFIRTLDECMKAAHATPQNFDQPKHKHTTSTSRRHTVSTTVISPSQPALIRPPSRNKRASLAAAGSRSVSESSAGDRSPAPPAVTVTTAAEYDVASAVTSGGADHAQICERENRGDLTKWSSHAAAEAAASNESSAGNFAVLATNLPTFFSTLKHSFSSLELRGERKEICTRDFLDAFVSILGIFDVFSATAFAPIKTDANNNLRKIEEKLSTDEKRFGTLQAMVLAEVADGVEKNSQSTTVGLLWLKRSLSFLRETLYEVTLAQHEFSDCVQNAYSKTIKPYHGWVIRGVFALAMKAVPTRSHIISRLAADEESADDPRFEPTLMFDMEQIIAGIDRTISALHDFYTQNDLDFQDIVGLI